MYMFLITAVSHLFKFSLYLLEMQLIFEEVFSHCHFVPFDIVSFKIFPDAFSGREGRSGIWIKL